MGNEVRINNITIAGYKFVVADNAISSPSAANTQNETSETAKVTLSAFEQQYAERSGVTVEWLHAHDQFGAPCDCEDPSCSGWQMKTV